MNTSNHVLEALLSESRESHFVVKESFARLSPREYCRFFSSTVLWDPIDLVVSGFPPVMWPWQKANERFPENATFMEIGEVSLPNNKGARQAIRFQEAYVL